MMKGKESERESERDGRKKKLAQFQSLWFTHLWQVNFRYIDYVQRWCGKMNYERKINSEWQQNTKNGRMYFVKQKLIANHKI